MVGSASAYWRPQSESEKQKVLEQLKRVMQSPGFANSQRYPGLLRYVVEQTLAGNEDGLKERLLGIEVFHRAPDYDTNQDPVVRLSAAEVRKRLALYYQSPDHQQELVIGLNPGTYVPVFRTPETPSLPFIPAEPENAGESPSRRRTTAWLPWAIGLTLIVGLVLGWYALSRPTISEEFWWPVLNSPAVVTICVGSPITVNSGPDAASPSTVFEKTLHSGQISKENVSALIHIGAELEQHHRSLRLKMAQDSSFPELREGPVILVGALDNQWTMRLTEPLRYGFAMDNASMWILDRKNPASRNWSVLLNQPPSSQSSDYSVIARYHDQTLGQPVILAAGLSSEGTEALGEILADPSFFRQLFRGTRENVKTVNFEAVIQTQVVEGHPGPSRILAVEFW